MRDIFFLFYKTGAKSLIDNKESKKYFNRNHFDYYRQAIKYSEFAISYDPHENVVENVDKLVDLFNLPDKINSCYGKMQIFLLTIGIIPSVFNYTNGEYIFGVFFILVLILQAYKSMLKLDTETLQLTNQKLVFTKEDLEAFPKKKEDLIAAYIWNKALCSYSCIPSLTVLIFIRKLSNNVYNQVVVNLLSFLADYMPIYVEDKSRLKFCSYVINQYIINKKQKETQL